MHPKRHQHTSPLLNGPWGIILFVLVLCVMFAATYQGATYVVDQRTLLTPIGYKPASVERYVLDHVQELGLTATDGLVTTCHIWKDPTVTTYRYHKHLEDYLVELEDYVNRVDRLRLGILDVRRFIIDDHNICKKVKLHRDGLPGIFRKSQQLSRTNAGWVEPLLTPMRHPRFCTEGKDYLMKLDYLIHDFYAMCNQLIPTSRTVFLDLGASLTFNVDGGSQWILGLYQKFGIQFDHIYAFEEKQIEPNKVFSILPPEYESAFHWINVGVSSNLVSRQNPFNMLKENFDEDDLIIVKLDISNANIAGSLVKQIRDDPKLAKLIDHFYFEQKVNQKEMAKTWGNQTFATVAESLRLFSDIRKQGISAHFWAGSSGVT